MPSPNIPLLQIKYQFCHNLELCIDCSVIANCLNCSDGPLCINCTVGYFVSSPYQHCDKCLPSCLACFDLNNCSLCQTGYFLKNYQCLPCGTYINNCVDCSPSACFSCENNTFISGNICTNCPSDQYADNLTQACLPCTFPCSVCSSINVCL